MRTSLLTAAIAASPALLTGLGANPAAAADLPCSKATTSTVSLGVKKSGTWAGEARRDCDWYKISLRKGQAYAFLGNQGTWTGLIRIRDRNGVILASGADVENLHAPWFGTEVVAAYDGTYYVEMYGKPDPQASISPGPSTSYSVTAWQDCASGWKTLCRLIVGETETRTISYPFDSDSFRLYLRAGQTYTITIDRPSAALSNPNNRFIAEFGWGSEKSLERFAPQVTGDHLLTFSDEHAGAGTKVTVSLRQP